MEWVAVLSLIVAVAAIGVSLYAICLQREGNKKLNTTKGEVSKVQDIVKNAEKNLTKVKDSVEGISFQSIRLIELIRYPEREEFKKINDAYRNIINEIFDQKESDIAVLNIAVEVKVEGENSSIQTFGYHVEVVKSDSSKVPKTHSALFDKFYIIKVIGPAFASGVEDSKIEEEYEMSPIKEGEYYGCHFDEKSCSWILKGVCDFGPEDRYEFYVIGGNSKCEEIFPANQVMGYSQLKNLNGNKVFEYQDIHFGLFTQDKATYITIKDAPPKKIYILERKRLVGQKIEQFLVFEHLRGYRFNKQDIKNLKEKILNIINRNEIEVKQEWESDDRNHHIKIPLDD